MTSGFYGRWVATHRLQGPVVRGSVSACRCTHYTSVAGGQRRRKRATVWQRSGTAKEKGQGPRVHDQVSRMSVPRDGQTIPGAGAG